MGPLSRAERVVGFVFLAACAGWVLGDLLRPLVQPFAAAFGRAWLWDGFRFQSKHYEAWVAMAAGLSLLAFRRLSLRGVVHLPWSTILLLGGSFAMAAGIDGSGLSLWMERKLSVLAGLPPFSQMLLATTAVGIIFSKA